MFGSLIAELHGGRWLPAPIQDIAQLLVPALLEYRRMLSRYHADEGSGSLCGSLCLSYCSINFLSNLVYS